LDCCWAAARYWRQASRRPDNWPPARGVPVFANRFSARMACGGGRFAPQRLAYFPEPAEAMLAGLKHLILVESVPPVSFFGYPGRRSYLAPEDCAFHVLAPIEGNGTEALAALVEECGVESYRPAAPEIPRPALPEGAGLTPDTIGQALASLLPEGSIVSDEMVSSGEAVLQHLASAASYDLLPITGGAIGQGLPLAMGAALACPGRKVIALEADGSGMYTLQSLWTMGAGAAGCGDGDPGESPLPHSGYRDAKDRRR